MIVVFSVCLPGLMDKRNISVSCAIKSRLEVSREVSRQSLKFAALQRVGREVYHLLTVWNNEEETYITIMYVYTYNE
jgi:hypothetical protein